MSRSWGGKGAGPSELVKGELKAKYPARPKGCSVERPGRKNADIRLGSGEERKPKPKQARFSGNQRND